MAKVALEPDTHLCEDCKAAQLWPLTREDLLWLLLDDKVTCGVLSMSGHVHC